MTYLQRRLVKEATKEASLYDISTKEASKGGCKGGQ